jgi:ribosomal protein S24E
MNVVFSISDTMNNEVAIVVIGQNSLLKRKAICIVHVWLEKKTSSFKHVT